jgi:hypothetical protein
MNGLNKQQLHILQHTLGLNEYGEHQGKAEGYRNHFCADEGHSSWGDLITLVDAGYMIKRYPCAVTNCWFSVTELGREAVKKESPKPPKISKSKARYLRYLEMSDGFDSFIDFCRWDAEPERSWNGGLA